MRTAHWIVHCALLCGALTACSQNDSGKAIGESCGDDDDCASRRCDELVCKSASPLPAGAPCANDYECASELCAGGLCAASRADGGLDGVVEAGRDTQALDGQPPPDAGPQALPASCSADRWCWVAPWPQGNPLSAVWANGASDIFAVGAAGAVVHYDGTSWGMQRSGTSDTLNSVWGSSATDVYAVSDTGTIHHFDGALWRSIYEANRSLRGVWGSSSSYVIAAGAQGTLLRFDGSAWQPIGDGTTSSSDLRFVWGFSPTDFYVGGFRATFHYDGTAFSEVLRKTSASSPYDCYHNGAWGSHPSDVYVIRRCDDSEGFFSHSEVVHFDGQNWVETTITTGHAARAIWGSGPSDIYVAATTIEYGILEIGRGAIFRFDGTRWAEALSTAKGGLDGLAGLSATQRVAVGGHGQILHDVGAGWQPIWPGNTKTLQDVRAISSDDLIFVGEGGAALRLRQAQWQSLPLITSADFFAVTAETNDITLAGDEVHRYDGTRWRQLVGAPSGPLLDACALDPQTLLFTGRGLVHRLSNDSWSSEDPGFAARGVWCISSHEAVAVGENGGVARHDGSGWTVEPTPTLADLNAAHGNSSGTLFVVGDYGAALYRQGGAWLNSSPPTTKHLSDVWALSDGSAVAVGRSGTIVRHENGMWRTEGSGTTRDLHAVWGASDGSVYVAGQGGAVLRYTP